MTIIQKYMIQTFAVAAINVIITSAYIAYKNYMGYFWANGFIFASAGALPLLSVLLVLSSLVLLGLSIWRVCGVLIYFKVNKYLTIAAKNNINLTIHFFNLRIQSYQRTFSSFSFWVTTRRWLPTLIKQLYI